MGIIIIMIIKKFARDLFPFLAFPLVTPPDYSMMETLTYWICLHAEEAHWIIFLMLLLAGLNVPLSEDVLLLCGGAIVGTCVSKGYVFFYSTPLSYQTLFL